MERTNLPQMNFVNMMSRIYPANLLSKYFYNVECVHRTIKKLGAYDNSTIIITSDHGTIDRPQMIFFIKEKMKLIK